MRAFSTTSLEWVVGMLCVALGALMLVAPHEFGGPGARLQQFVPEIGAGLLLAGCGLLSTAVLAPRDALRRGAYLLAGGMLLALGGMFSLSDRWNLVVAYAILGMGTAIAPFLSRGLGRDGRSSAASLLRLVLGLSSGATGVLLLVVPPELMPSTAYDLVRPLLGAFGALFCGAGIGLAAVQVWPKGARLSWTIYLFFSLVQFAWLVVVSVPSHTWAAVAYYGASGIATLVLPWLANPVRRLDPSSLRARLALALAAAAAIPLLIFASVYAREEEGQSASSLLAREETLAAALAHDVATYVGLHQAAVMQLAARHDLLMLSPGEQHEALRAAATAYPDIVGFGTVSPAGDTIARADDRQGTSWIGDPVFEETRATHLPALATRISPVLHRPIFSLGVPVVGADGQYIGMVGSALESSRIAALLRGADSIEGATVFLVNESGHVIAHPDPDLVSGFADLSTSPPVAAFLGNPAPTGSLGSTRPDSDTLAGFARVPALNWGVVVELSTPVALTPIRTKLDLFYVGLLLAIATAAGAGFFLAGRLTRPLVSLGAALDSLAAGDVGAALPLGTFAEISRVAEAFSHMRAELASRIAALRAGEERYRSLIEVSPDGIFLQTDSRLPGSGPVDLTMVGFVSHLQLIYANQAALRIFGATEPRQLLGQSMMDFVLPESKEDPSIVERLNIMAAGGQAAPAPSERRCVRLDGTEFLLEVSTTPVSYEGQPVFLSVFRDITARRQVEDALRQQAAVLALAPVAIIVRDLDSRVTYWNRGAETLYGWSAEEAHSQVTYDLLQSALPASHELVVGTLIERGTWESELRHRRRDGMELTVASRWALLRDSSDQPLAILEINTDITERKRAEAALRSAESQLRKVVSSLPVVFFAIDSEGVFTLSEGLGLGILGREPGQVVGQSAFEMYRDDPAVLGQLRRALGGDAFSSTNQIGEFVFETYYSPILDTYGAVVGITGFGKEISERRAIERLKDSFVAMVSHELRTPMNGVIGMTDLLLESELSSVQRDYVETIRDSGASLVTIVNDILDFSRLQADQVELESIDLDVRSIVGRVVELLVGSARQKGVDLISSVHRDVPVRLNGDAARFRQVLVNLVSNAIKFTDAGEVTLEVRALDSSPGKVVLRCDVVDTGVGIQPAAIDHLFEPFHQADSSITRRFGGTGLGLAICKRLVAAMGGEISVSSEPGVGSTFSFTIVLEHSAQADAPISSASVRDLRVVLVDAHPLRSSGIRELLLAWGVPVTVHPSASQMLQAELVQLPADRRKVVVLAHLPLADMELVELVERLQALPAGASVALVCLDDATNVGTGVDGVRAVLASPPRQSHLYDVLAAIADPSPGSRQHGPEPGRAHPAPTAPIDVGADTPRVLVVDDQEINRRVAERMLARLGYQVLVVPNGLQALSAFDQSTYAAILLDVQMPEMDGFAVALEIRQRESAGSKTRTPIIALTAQAQAGDREACLAAGMDDYLSKPVELSELRRVLSHWVAISVPSTHSVLDPRALEQIEHLEEPGQPSLLGEMTAIFIATAPEHMARLADAVATGDSASLVGPAHALKGAAAALGATRVHKIADDLEMRGREHHVDGAADLLVALQAALDEAVQALSNYEPPPQAELAA